MQASRTEQHRVGSDVALRLDRPAEARTERAVLYLHGLGSNQTGEKTEFFRARFRAARCAFASIDFRGHGDSGGSTRDLTMSRNVADAKAARDHLLECGLPEVDLMGSSLGALTALWLARLEPRRLRAVVALAPAVGIEAKIRRALGAAGVEDWERDGSIPYANELGTIDIGYGFLTDLAEHSEERLGHGYSTPTLILQGELDESVDAARVAEFAGRIDSVQLHLWPDGDHRLTDRLDEVWDRTRDFLGL